MPARVEIRVAKLEERSSGKIGKKAQVNVKGRPRNVSMDFVKSASNGNGISV